MVGMNPQRLTIVTVAVAVLAVAAILVIPRLTSPPQVSAQVEFDTQPRIGAADAPVTVAVFEDWLCPSCAQFDATVTSTIKREYVATGQVQLVFVNFLVISGSDQVARLGECVYQQSNEAFWEMKPPLYRAQSELRDPRRARALALDFAPGIDAGQLDTCLADAANLEPARRDTRLAQSLSLTGTPSVLVNGTAVSPTLAEVRRAIDAALR
jgi:protein-disulfide isomerase